jgi:hypothetical protein
MKTNRTARNIVRTRLTVACLVFLGLAGVAFKAGETLGKQSARATASPVEILANPTVDMRVVIAAN